jgi:hypothetical protein
VYDIPVDCSSWIPFLIELADESTVSDSYDQVDPVTIDVTMDSPPVTAGQTWAYLATPPGCKTGDNGVIT